MTIYTDSAPWGLKVSSKCETSLDADAVLCALLMHGSIKSIICWGPLGRRAAKKISSCRSEGRSPQSRVPLALCNMEPFALSSLAPVWTGALVRKVQVLLNLLFLKVTVLKLRNQPGRDGFHKRGFCLPSPALPLTSSCLSLCRWVSRISFQGI